MNDEPKASDGPILDLEPDAAPESAAAKPRLRLARQGLLASGAVLAVAIAMLAGAYAYGQLGFDMFGGSVSDRLGVLETRITAMEQNAQQQGAERQAVADRLDALAQALESLPGLQTRMTAVESQQAALSSSVEVLQKQPPGTGGVDAAVLSQMQAELKDLQARLAGLAAVDSIVGQLSSAFSGGQPLGDAIDGLQDPTIKAALLPYRDQAAPSRTALAQELTAMAASLNDAVPQMQTAPDDSWEGFFWRQLSRFYTIRPAGAELALKLAQAAKAEDISAAVLAIKVLPIVPDAASAWLAKAESWLAADAAISRLKAGAN